MTPPATSWRIDRGTGIGILGLVGVAGYLALLTYAMRFWPYDRWMLLVLIPVLIASGLTIIVRVTRNDVEPLTRLIALALLAKLAAAYVRYFFVTDVYGKGDANRYDRVGAEIANAFHSGTLSLAELVPSQVGTPFMEQATGVLYSIVGPSQLGGFLIFAWISFFGIFLFHRAALIGLPEGDQRRYALLIFFLPSLLFWPSSIGKEALMMGALGLCGYGAAKVLAKQPSGWLALGLGLGLGYLVRPHVPVVVLAALAVALLFRRRGSRASFFGPVGRLLLVGAMILVLAFALGQAVDRLLGPDSSAPVADAGGPAEDAEDSGVLTEPDLDAVGELLDRASTGTDDADSSIDRPLPASPLEYPSAAFTVLFRPTIVEATNGSLAIAAVETSFVLVLFVASWRRLMNVPTIMFRRPYVLFCIVYTGIFAFAWSSFSNLGALARQRVQVWPFLLVLLAIPVVLEATRPAGRRAAVPLPTPSALERPASAAAATPGSGRRVSR